MKQYPFRRFRSQSLLSLKQNRNGCFSHISLRITEKIKSAYPDATWRWADSPDLTAILDGKTFRIQVDDMAAFTHADIRFDRYARIRITPLSVGEFASSADSGKKTPSEEDTKEPAVVDVISWYELIGRQCWNPLLQT